MREFSSPESTLHVDSLFLYPFHPCVTTVTHKRPQWLCQKCKWQVIPKDLSPTAHLFAHDTLYHKDITTAQVQAALQQDLDHQVQWLKSFHLNKCHTLHTTIKKNLLHHQYHLHGHCSLIIITGTCTSQISPTGPAKLRFLRRNLKVNSITIKNKCTNPWWSWHWSVQAQSGTSSQQRTLWKPLKLHRLQTRLTTFFKHHHREMVLNFNFIPAKTRPPIPTPCSPTHKINTVPLTVFQHEVLSTAKTLSFLRPSPSRTVFHQRWWLPPWWRHLTTSLPQCH